MVFKGYKLSVILSINLDIPIDKIQRICLFLNFTEYKGRILGVLHLGWCLPQKSEIAIKLSMALSGVSFLETMLIPGTWVELDVEYLSLSNCLYELRQNVAWSVNPGLLYWNYHMINISTVVCWHNVMQCDCYVIFMHIGTPHTQLSKKGSGDGLKNTREGEGRDDAKKKLGRGK